MLTCATMQRRKPPSTTMHMVLGTSTLRAALIAANLAQERRNHTFGMMTSSCLSHIARTCMMVNRQLHPREHQKQVVETTTSHQDRALMMSHRMRLREPRKDHSGKSPMLAEQGTMTPRAHLSVATLGQMSGVGSSHQDRSTMDLVTVIRQEPQKELSGMSSCWVVKANTSQGPQKEVQMLSPRVLGAASHQIAPSRRRQ